LTSPVTHFEIYGEEPAALAEFYRQLFDWRLERAPGVDYWRIETAASPGRGIAGGLTHRPIAGTRGWMHYVHVASLDDAVAEAERLGAAVLRPKTAVPKTAWYAVLTDPEGNIFAIWQPDANAMPLPEPE
jgi:predicted enzyme related to lactoylglutathione lyase